jgi:hypothetical protein
MRRCLKDQKRVAAELRDQQSQQIERGLEVLENINTDNRRKHETNCLTFEKWQKVHRFTSMGALEECMNRVDPLQPSKEHSHTQKIEIVRRQLQLRKQHDGVTKMGYLTMTNRAGKDDPSPENGLLDMLLENFRVVLQCELMHGIKAPKVPELVKPRDPVVGSTSLAKKLLQDQREKTAAHARAFYAQRHDGTFTAFKMTRTRVSQPKQHIGAHFKKLFSDDKWCAARTTECHDDVQRWKAVYDDGDAEDHTCADMMAVLGPSFVCGALRSKNPGASTAAGIRAENRSRRLNGRRNPLGGVVAELVDVAAGAEFELPAHYVETAGTKWRLLRVYFEESTGRQVAAYCGVDEATAIPEEDIAQLSMQDLEREYDIEVAEHSAVQSRISASQATAATVVSHTNTRRSKRLSAASN